MALYHLSVKIVSRGKGQSAVAKAAYNSRELLTNDQTGERHDYRRESEVLFSGIFAPKEAPEWVQDRQTLWNTVEQTETRKNSQLAREIEIGLPYELTDKQREFLVKDFVRENFVRRGMVADVAIHAPGPESDNRNYHAHILLTMREIGPEGFGAKMRDLNSNAQLEDWREKWEHIANRHLERHGHEARIDRRSLEAQGIDREPTIHIGPTACQLEKEGITTERGNINREIEERNQQREQLQAQGREVSQELLLVQREQQAESAKDFSQHQETAKQERQAERLETAQRTPEVVAEKATLKQQAREIDHAADKGLKAASRILGGMTKPLEGLIDFLVGVTPETPEQIRAKAEERSQRAAEGEKREADQERAVEQDKRNLEEQERLEREKTNSHRLRRRRRR